jgi:lipopolysaccharide transport system ATP-binding protein
MSDEILIRAENVGKKFCRNLKKSLMYGAQDIGYDLLGKDRSHAGLRKDEFWANEGISFELRRGECLGLIGKNGAGKTTLLKMLNGLIKPDAGHIEMHGRVEAMIALGAGFNPILTGRENIYIAASVLGFSRKEVDQRFDEIVDFAEISEFIDTPVQSYSSGMQVRLGFAVASNLDPDILLIDEVLAVGDVGFRTKCYNRIYELCKNTAIIFVSHSMPQVARLCDECIVLKRGKSIHKGDVTSSIDMYDRVNEKLDGGGFEISNHMNVKEIKINNIIVNQDKIYNFEQLKSISINMKLPIEVKEIDVSIYFKMPSGDIITYSSNSSNNVCLKNNNQWFVLNVSLPEIIFGSGMRILTIRVLDSETKKILYWKDKVCSISQSKSAHIPAPIYIPCEFEII